jgi:hypothetical protein
MEMMMTTVMITVLQDNMSIIKVECNVDIGFQPKPENHLRGTEQEGVPFSFIAVKQEVVSIVIYSMSNEYSLHMKISEKIVVPGDHISFLRKRKRDGSILYLNTEQLQC